MKYLISELSGEQLDLAVYKSGFLQLAHQGDKPPPYSRLWALGGLLVERYHDVAFNETESGYTVYISDRKQTLNTDPQQAEIIYREGCGRGDTRLVALCRAHLNLLYGDEVAYD